MIWFECGVVGGVFVNCIIWDEVCDDFVSMIWLLIGMNDVLFEDVVVVWFMLEIFCLFLVCENWSEDDLMVLVDEIVL